MSAENPFEELVGSGGGLLPHFQPSKRVMPGSRWAMRDVDPGPDNDFTVTRSGYVHDPGEMRLAVEGLPEPKNWVEYHLTGSDDLDTKRPEDEFLQEFKPLEVLPKQTVTAKRESGFPWILLILGALVALS